MAPSISKQKASPAVKFLPFLLQVSPNLFCGSQPQSPDDIQQLHENVGIGTVVNLQQDKDFAYWNVDHGAHQHRASEIGLNIVRCPVRCPPSQCQSSLHQCNHALAADCCLKAP